MTGGSAFFDGLLIGSKGCKYTNLRGEMDESKNVTFRRVT